MTKIVTVAIDPLMLKGLGWTAKTLYGYFHLRDYFSLQVRKHSHKTDRHVYDRYAECGEEEFWKDMLSEVDEMAAARPVLREGHVVTLKGFQITDWLPLLPGTWW